MIFFFLFFLLLLGRPFALQNCSVSNQSIDSLTVECVEGFDGGLPQAFLLELVEMPALKLVRNLSLQVMFQLANRDHLKSKQLLQPKKIITFKLMRKQWSQILCCHHTHYYLLRHALKKAANF